MSKHDLTSTISRSLCLAVVCGTPYARRPAWQLPNLNISRQAPTNAEREAADIDIALVGRRAA
jgi:hypothetical protein